MRLRGLIWGMIFCIPFWLIAVLLVASPTWQLTGVIFTVIFAIIMGVVVGFITSKLGKTETITDDTKEFCTE